MQLYHEQLDFDGWWLDINDLSSWCTGSCGTGRLQDNPVHVPFKLPGEPGQINYDYPEAFDQTNATEAASASAASISQASAYPTPTTTMGTATVGFTSPTPGVRNITFPPYALNLTLPGHSLLKEGIAPYAVHNDEFSTTEYELHNTYGYTSGKATYNALLTVFPGKRPFWISRSTSPGSGALTGHWGGDTNSRWGNMYTTIPQALTFSIAGIPYFGVETCGFNGNTDMELCTRWMQLSAFFPLYRNHNSRNTIAQEAYRWATTAEATRRVMDVRFRLLPYQYTLFWAAHTRGETVLRALAWNFPDDESLKAIDNQFMLGPSILITPVLAPLLRTSQGVFPGVPDTRWYDWYSLEEVKAQAGENVTLDAPLEHIPVHVRGGSIIASQLPGNTTKMTRMNPWSILIALDSEQQAKGELYLDDGVSQEPSDIKEIEVRNPHKHETKREQHLRSVANTCVVLLCKLNTNGLRERDLPRHQPAGQHYHRRLGRRPGMQRGRDLGWRQERRRAGRRHICAERRAAGDTALQHCRSIQCRFAHEVHAVDPERHYNT